MDAALRRFNDLFKKVLYYSVSILVLVDAALRHSVLRFLVQKAILSFNPCFSGCRPATLWYRGYGRECPRVSILVLVDAALRQATCNDGNRGVKVSILVLVDAALRRMI